MAIMAAREGLQFESTIESDSAPVIEPVLELLEADVETHCLRDLTRGGLARALNEIAEVARVKITVDEKLIRVRVDVHAACEMLGLDPLHVANEGRFGAFIMEKDSARVLEIPRRHTVSAEASMIGRVAEKSAPMVTIPPRDLSCHSL
jgi:hydrogenase expression/formation protein HypE